MPVLIGNYSLNTIPRAYSTAFSQEYVPVLSERLTESVTITNIETPYLNSRIFALLAEFEQLPQGWDEYDAAKPDYSAIRMAYYIALILEKTGQKIFHVAPGPNGEIMMDLRNSENGRSIEIIFNPQQKYVYVTFCSQSESTQSEFYINLLPELLEWLNEKMNG